MLDRQEAERRAQERQAARQRGAGPAILTGSRRAGEPEELSLVQQAGDVLVAPLRGLEGAAQDLYGLADAIAFDALPDYEERVFGVSRTAVGGLVEGVTNFAAGFVGADFVLPAKLFAKAGRFSSIARGAAKGALADFAVFDGNEQRLSDLVQAFPVLQNPISEFLASDQDDPEVYGRLKNVLEGLGIGAFVDAVGLGVKALGAGRKARAAGLSPREVEEAIDKAVPEDQLKAAWKAASEQDPGKASVDDIGSPTKPEAAEAVQEPASILREPDLDILAEANKVHDAHKGTIWENRLASDIQLAVVGAPSNVDNLITHNPESAREMYAAFEPVREKLRAKYGDSITLWRAQGKAARERSVRGGTKHTLNYGSQQTARRYMPDDVVRDPNFARRRVPNIERELTARRVAIEDILAINKSGASGKYEEYIVLQPGARTALLNPAPKIVGEDAGVLVLRSMGVDEAKARELYSAVRRREAPISVDLQGLPALDPKVAPRKLTQAERLEQELQLTDLNLSRYRGPEGALQLLRGMEQVFEPIKGLGDATRRSLKEQEATGLQQLADIVGVPSNKAHSLLVSLQKDVGDQVGLNRRIIGYKVAMQSAAADSYRLMQKATAPTAGDKDMLEFLESLEFLHDVELGVKSLLGEQGRGLGANRIPTRYAADMFSLDEIRDALHSKGGSGRAQDLAKKFKVLWASEIDPAARAAKAANMARGLAGRRAFGILNEYWYNALLGRPTTLVVATLSNAITTVYRPLENLLGGVLLGDKDVIVDSVREVMGLAQAAGESMRATVAAMKGEGALLDPKAVVSDIHDVSRRAISPENLGVKADTVHGQALTWLGRLVRYPSTALSASDQFFQQLNYRTVARSRLLKGALAANPGKSAAEVAGLVEEQMNALIHRGQAYGTAQLFHRGVEDAVKKGLTGKVAVDEHARLFAQQALQNPEHARLSAVSDLALGRAQEATFTTPLQPGTLPYRYQEAVRNHPLLRLVTPFVRTPTNVLKFAFDRNVNALTGLGQLVASKTFGPLAPSLEQSRNLLVRDILSGDPRRKAEAMGRVAMGVSVTTAILFKAAETDEQGRPLITGFGPADREQRRLLEESGWQQYSIRVGDGYVSYGRLDPFATTMGTAADIMNYVKFANAEDQAEVENLSLGFAVAIAHNLTNKTYLSGLANFVDTLSDPINKFPVWARTLGASVVPGQAAAAVSASDPHLREVRSMMDALRARWPGASDDLPPLRNVLGEPVKRAQSLGAGISPITNAFVPVLYREVSDDLVRTELANLRYGFTPPKRTRGGLDLTTVVKGDRNAYDRWLELHGEVKRGGKTLRQSLRRLMTSAAYTRIPAESTDELSSPRIGLVQGVIDDYRSEAYRQLVREFPELAAADRARFQQRLKLRRGQETRPALLRSLQGGQ